MPNQHLAEPFRQGHGRNLRWGWQCLTCDTDEWSSSRREAVLSAFSHKHLHGLMNLVGAFAIWSAGFLTMVSINPVGFTTLGRVWAAGLASGDAVIALLLLWRHR